MNKRVLLLELAVVLVILLAGTYIFRTTDLDLQIQRAFYSETDGWFRENLPVYYLSYHYGNIPAILTVIGAILLLVAGFKKKKYALYRKINIYIILAMLIGPGLIVNALFKEHWGRPRPRHIEEFGGRMEYLQVWDKGVSGTGSSFPCGHASMGYFFFVFFFILRKKKKLLSILALIFSLAFGTVIGVSRIAQGGHFASDVLWTAGFLYLTSLFLFHLFGLEQNLYWTKELKNKIGKPAIFVLLALIPLSVYLLLLATPYYKEGTVDFPYSDSSYHSYNLNIEKGDITLVRAESLSLTFQAQGFGFPGSKMKFTRSVQVEQDTTFIDFLLYHKGLFTELNNQVTISLDPEQRASYRIKVTNGEIHSDDTQLYELFEVKINPNEYLLTPIMVNGVTTDE